MKKLINSHSFDIEDAEKYGVDEAIMLYNIKFWVNHNQANNKNFHDDRHWTFNSKRAFAVLFPYWTEKQVRRILNNLIEKGAIISGNYNKAAYDRTLWYTISDEYIHESLGPNGPIVKPERANQSDSMGQPIPDINTNINTGVIPINKIDTQIYETWNSIESLQTHSLSVINKRIKKKHIDIIKDYSIDVVVKAIRNYADIVKSDKYFFSFKWPLWDFISRGVDKFVDEATPHDNFKADGKNGSEKKAYKELSKM